MTAIVPGDPEKSAAWERIISTDPDEIMPPPESHKTLTDEQKIAHQTLDQARRHLRTALGVHSSGPSHPARHPGHQTHRCFHPRSSQKGKPPAAPPAAKFSQLRRVTLDLTGFPPTVAELEAFEKDTSSDAYEKAVERLLASPRHARHFAMNWLDAARYADTNGFQGDGIRMNWPWRDWVVNAIRNNMPFDQFSIEQLAGDLLPDPTTDQLVATAFNRNHMLNAEGGSIPEENRHKNVFDRVETTGTVWLGLTMNCAQCHDHKFDPIKQSDYYSMSAIFNQISEPGGVDKRFGRKPYSDTYDSLYVVESPFITLPNDEQSAALAAAKDHTKAVQAAFDALKPQFHPQFKTWVQEMIDDRSLIEKRLSDPEIARAISQAKLDNVYDFWTRRLVKFYLEKIDTRFLADYLKIDAARDAENEVLQTIPHVMVMRDDKPRDTFILDRGSYETPGKKVAATTPSFLPPVPEGVKTDRLSFARWLFTPEQPLTSRVLVNRLWQQFFGHGLVKTPDDFGLQGELPSHPELLDWLAVEFRESGWDQRHMIRLVVNSDTYRRDHSSNPQLTEKDPSNALHARGPRFRLDSRVLRDQALALSGLLVETEGGPAVSPYQPPGIWEEMSFGKNRYFQDKGEKLHRPSLYTFWRRTVAPANFFDVPARQVCGVKMNRTSTPLHALITLNDTTYVEAARVWASRITPDSDEVSTLTEIFRAATSRMPEDKEIAALRRALANARSHFSTRPEEAAKLIATGEAPGRGNLPPIDHAAWTTLCLLVLNLDETLNP